MTTTTTNTFEGGTTSTAISTGNSGGASGTAYTVVTSGAPTLEFSSAQKMHGSLSAHYAGSSGNNAYLRRDHATTDLYFARRLYFRWNGAVANSIAFVQLRDNAGSPAVKFQVLTNGSGRIQVSDAGGTNQIFSTVTIAADAWYRLEIQGQVGTTTSNGVLNAQLFAGDGTTALQSVSSSTANLGTAPPAQWRLFGANGGDMYIDSDTLVTDTATVAPLGVFVPSANTAPVVSPGSAQTISGTTASLSGSATDSGTLVSATWSLLSTTAATNPTVGASSNTGGGSSNMTAVAAVTGLTAGSTSVFRLAASDGSLSGTGDVTIYCPGSPVGPNRVVSNVGNWVAVNAASLYAALNKTADDDTSYAETPATPSNASVIFGVEPVLAGDTTVPFRARYQGTGVFTCTPKVYSGTTLVTTSPAPITLTNTFQNYSVALSPSENAALTNRTDTRVELVATQS